MTLNIRTQARVPRDGAVTIFVEGEVDVSLWEEFRERIVSEAEEGVDLVALDLSDVSFFDSSAIRALLAARQKLEDRGIDLCIDERSDLVARVLDAVNLNEYFPRSDCY